MPADKYHQRITSLFTDIERLASDANVGDNPRIRSELEALRTRLFELEGWILENLQSSVSADAGLATNVSPVSSTMVEKDRSGYIYSDGEVESIPAQTLPQLDSGKTLPLIASGQEIGEVHVEIDRSWTAEESNLANMVAYQASLQIENLRLLAAAERARVEAQEATRQFAQKNWEAFLDAIHNNEQIGFVYNQVGVQPALAPPEQHDYLESVQIFDEQIGKLFVKADSDRPLTEDDKSLIQSIAKQIGQQVEGIRLLADAARARAEAEEATRRLTRQNWEAFVQNQEQDSAGLGFVYDSIRVSSLGSKSIPQDFAFEQPLVVRGEDIGHLAVSGIQNISEEAKDLAAAIASQASIHLETLRLTEELQKRARELQELDRLKSAFLANMSHELRTPLNSILGFADVMIEGLDGPLTPNMENDLKLIQKNGQHLLHLINDVLDMAKIESGKLNLIIEKFNLHEIFEEVASITSPLASEKDIALFIESDSDKEVFVSADRTRLRQVLINLMNNAMKFTDKGKISIYAACEDRENVLIAVKDTGVGIPSDHLESIFHEFTQVDSSTTRKVGGTGLGLPISRRLIEMHGGKLWAESSGVEGEGSTFYVILPIEAKVTESEPVTKGK